MTAHLHITEHTISAAASRNTLGDHPHGQSAVAA